jgi:hypothetical protein
MRYVYAISACIGLFIVYTIIGGIMGWKHGGGAIPMILFFAAVVWTWRAIIGTKRGEK